MKITFASKNEIKKFCKLLCAAYPADIVISVDDLRNAQENVDPDLPWDIDGLHMPVRFSDEKTNASEAEMNELPDRYIKQIFDGILTIAEVARCTGRSEIEIIDSIHSWMKKHKIRSIQKICVDSDGRSWAATLSPYWRMTKDVD